MSSRLALIASFILVASRADADTFGVSHLGTSQPHLNPEVVVRLSATGPQNRQYVWIDAERKGDPPVAFHLRSGMTGDAGAASLRLCFSGDIYAPNPLCAAEMTATVAPHSWTRVPIPPGSIAPGPTNVWLLIEPLGSGDDVELVGLRTYDISPRLGLSVRPYTLAQDWNTFPEASAWHIQGDGGASSYIGDFKPAFLVEYAAEDPWAPSSCTGTDRNLVLGNPYFRVEEFAVPEDGGAAQTFLGPAVPSFETVIEYYNYGLKYWRLPIAGPADAGFQLDFSGPGVPYQVELNSLQQSVNFCALTGPWNKGLPMHRLTLRPHAPGLKWQALSAGDGLSTCSAAARATLSGTMGSAIVGTEVFAGKDFVFSSEISRVTSKWRDRDRDGFGNPNDLDDCGNPDGTLRTSAEYATDCDDTRADVNPDAGELCDLVDNDCDGVIDTADPSLRLAFCERGLSECYPARHSREQCVQGAWRACDASNYGSWYQPVETDPCDGWDNDCSGSLLTEFENACARQLGVCANSKRTQCPVIACTAADYGQHYELDESRCDGLDNDCDGEVDEACAPERPDTVKGCGCGSADVGAVLMALLLTLRLTWGSVRTRSM